MSVNGISGDNSGKHIPARRRARQQEPIKDSIMSKKELEKARIKDMEQDSLKTHKETFENLRKSEKEEDKRKLEKDVHFGLGRDVPMDEKQIKKAKEKPEVKEAKKDTHPALEDDSPMDAKQLEDAKNKFKDAIPEWVKQYHEHLDSLNEQELKMLKEEEMKLEEEKEKLNGKMLKQSIDESEISKAKKLMFEELKNLEKLKKEDIHEIIPKSGLG